MKCPNCGCEIPKTAENKRCPDCGIRIKGKKPAPKKERASCLGTLFWLFLSVVPLIIGLILLITGIPNTVEYYCEVKPRIEEITAVISRIEEYEDSDGDTQHNVYVTYQYGGTVYKDVDLSHYNSSMAKGDQITVELDPENPEKLASSPLGSTIAGACAILFGCLVSWFVWIRPVISERKASAFRADPKKLTRERIAFELADSHASSGFVILFSTGMTVGFLVFEVLGISMLFSGEWEPGLLMALIGPIFLIFPAIFFFALRDDRKIRRAVKQDSFLVVRAGYASFTEKTAVNPDGPDGIYWVFQFHNCDLTCKSGPTSTRSTPPEDGELFCLVALPDEKEALRSYRLADYDCSSLHFDKTY